MVATPRNMPGAPNAAASDVGDPDDGLPVLRHDPIDPAEFRHAFRQLASTVALLTLIGRDGRPRGMTVTSMCGLSVEPPTLLVCVDRAARTYGDLMATNGFGVDALAEGQYRIAARCARSGTDKVLPAEWLLDRTSGDLPHLAGTVVRLGCTVEAIHRASTHDIVVGQVRTIDVDPAPAAPLVYHDGAFGRLGPVRIPLALADRFAPVDEG
jgi:flavin reductase (DIM6/NTAB) family NADH-FMN oxidoreductase RutF